MKVLRPPVSIHTQVFQPAGLLPEQSFVLFCFWI